MNRRRILLSYLANSFSWELYSKVYFYNELVPTTINSKNVLNKAKIVKVSGNGAIENQLVNPTPPTQTINGVTFTNNGDGSWTVNGTATANTIKTVSSVFQTISGHYYLICGCANGGSNSTYRLLESYTYRWADIGSGYIQTASSSGNSSIAIEVKSGITCNNLIFRPQFKDLTLMFGTGNEPTTLTDNRIQNILNRGYIAYNLGKYKESDIGVVSSEPYNLFDGEMELGTINNSTGQNEINNGLIRSKNYISIVGGKSYNFNLSANYTLLYFLYDENYNYLSYDQLTFSGESIAINMPNNAKYLRFRMGAAYGTTYNNDICFHLTGTRTGYAPYKTFTPITFKAQLGGAINSHDTMEIGKENVVFTKDSVNVSFDNVGGWTYDSSHTRFYSGDVASKYKTPADNDTLANMLCSKYTTLKQQVLFDGTQDKAISYSASGIISLRDTSLNGDASLISGDIQIQLATPQVITIPRKHLGILDLGSLTGYVSNDKYFISAEHFGISTASSNNNGYSCYCKDYMVDSGYNVYNKTTDRTMCLTSPFIGGNFIIWDSSFVGKNADEIKALLSGTLLFYETENEVADITNVVDIESGGTITTDSEVLPNIELSVKCK